MTELQRNVDTINLDSNAVQHDHLKDLEKMNDSDHLSPSNKNNHWKIIILTIATVITLIGISAVVIRQYNIYIKNTTSISIPEPLVQVNTESNNSTNPPTPAVEQVSDDDKFSEGTKLINQMRSVSDVPEKIEIEGRVTFNLYYFKEEKINPYCDSDDKSSACLRQSVFGDYSMKSGINCEGNAFFNPLNPQVNKVGVFYNEDENRQTIPHIYDSFTVIKSLPYELFTGSTYEAFLLKRTDNTCHPYKLTFNYLKKGTPPSDRNRLSAVKFNVSDSKIFPINYSDYRFGCGGSSTRLVENDPDILNYLEKITDIGEGVALYTLKPIANFDDKILQFNFPSSITTKSLQNGGGNYLQDSRLSAEDKISFINNIANEKSVIFVKDSLFPDVFFVYTSFDVVAYPGC